MGVRAIYQLETPWSEDEIFDVGYEQAADVVVLTHLDHRQVRLTRYAHDNWTLLYANYLATVTPPGVFTATGLTPNVGTGYTATTYTYVVTTLDEASGQESLPTGEEDAVTDLTLKGNTVELSWTAVTGAERYNVYRKGGGAFGYVGTTDSTTFTDDNIAPDFSQSYPRARDPFESQSADDANGLKPAVVAFWQQRAVYGRTLKKPNAIFASQSGNLFNFNASRPTNPADAVTFAVSGRRVNAIMHLVPLKNLIVFTTDTIFSVGNDFEPTKIDIEPENYRGASRVRPVTIDDIVFFHCSKGGSIRTLGYQFEADGYRGNDLTVFAPHFFENVFAVDMTWSEFPLSVLPVVMSDGDVRVLTWQAEQQVWGWTKWQTSGQFESCCTVSEGGEDVTYFVIKRGTKRFVEYSATSRWTDVADAVYLDSAIRYVGDPKTDFSRALHLAGMTTDVLADGAVYSGVHIDSTGAFSLPQPAGRVTVGLPYESWIRTLPLGMDALKGEPKLVAGAVVRVKKSRGLEIGIGKELPPGQFEPITSDDEIDGPIDEIKTREAEMMGDPTALFSGELQVDAEPGDWRSADVVVRQRYPLPMTVLGITPDYVPSE